MPRETIDKRVESLELRMSDLESLPAPMSALEGQIVQLRDEMHSEFSDVRTEMRSLNDVTLNEMRTLNEQTNVHMRVLHEDVMSRLARMEEGRPTRSMRRKKS
jgi:chaperonin cofactor prefoldin